MREQAFRWTTLDKVLLALISVYQKRISPRKGWRCAYSVLHGGTGCSGYARETIQLQGGLAALPLVRQRFRECKQAAHAIRAFTPIPSDDPSKGKNPKNGESSRSDWCSDCGPDLDCCSCAEGLPHLSSCHPGHCDVGHCDVSGCDVGGCDGCHLGGCDGCDCGGCSW